MTGKSRVILTVNGRAEEAWVWPNQSLLHVLRDELGHTEVKYGCGEGVCGTCTVLLDGASVNSCLLFAIQVGGRNLTTVKGLGEDQDMHPLQERFLELGASQCGFCTPGMLLVAHEFLSGHPDADREEIRDALGGNLCRCTGYTKIVEAVETYARERAVPRPRDGQGD
jgi:carbon-monoxide dehydrogenase small subunit